MKINLVLWAEELLKEDVELLELVVEYVWENAFLLIWQSSKLLLFVSSFSIDKDETDRNNWRITLFVVVVVVVVAAAAAAAVAVAAVVVVGVVSLDVLHSSNSFNDDGKSSECSWSDFKYSSFKGVIGGVSLLNISDGDLIWSWSSTNW